MATRVVVSRHWNHPQIETFVSNELIAMSVRLDDFLAALAYELGDPARIQSKVELSEAISRASEVVISKIKQASTQVMGRG